MATGPVGSLERAVLLQSLAAFAPSLTGHVVNVDLRNESQVRGTVIGVDCFMNITMEKAELLSCSGHKIKMPLICIQAKFIFGFQIPDKINVTKMLQEQVDIYSGAKRRAELKKAKEQRALFLRKKERLRMTGRKK